jgi:prepilin-type N-terminal cleavage/methylation domain-containing protein
MRKEQGFTIIELLIVVAIIGLISAIAVPNLRRARRQANSASAIQSLRTITTAENLYDMKFKVYGTLADLAPEGTLDPQLASGQKHYYLFTITLRGADNKFACTATPIDDITVMPYYFVDETTVIRFNDGAPADATSDPIPR